MDETDHDAQWEHFINDQGRTVEKEVYDALQEDAQCMSGVPEDN